MLKLEDIKLGMQVAGLVPGEVAAIIQSVPAGADAVTVYYKTHSGELRERLPAPPRQPRQDSRRESSFSH